MEADKGKYRTMNPLFYIDFYKVGHVLQYPRDTEQVWSNWTPRYSHVAGTREVVHFGLQYFIKKYLIEEFSQFFATPIDQVLREYREVIKATLGVEPYTRHIEELHALGYLPLAIYSVPEGDRTPLRVPSMVVANTHPSGFWLPNYFESIMSAVLWRPSTSATTALRYRQIFEKWAREAGETDLSFVDWQGHDFSFRGMGGLEDAMLSGMGHLTSFCGTDTIPAILGARKYYDAPLTVGGSVPATEHSVMSAHGDANEFETFKSLLTEVYPSGIVSIVSDTWDLWKVLADYVPRLRDTILSRPGKIVIRPDSGDPVKILCGDPDKTGHVGEGAIRLLAAALGTKNKLIRNGGLIYGDSITPARAEAILSRTVRELDLSPYNVVFGIGSFTYAYVTRDTYGFAMKATAVRRSGKVIPIYKSPVTDDGGKISLRGIPIVYRKLSEPDDPEHGYYVRESTDPEQLDHCAMSKVFENGKLLVETSFELVRRRVRGQ